MHAPRIIIELDPWTGDNPRIQADHGKDICVDAQLKAGHDALEGVKSI